MWLIDGDELIDYLEEILQRLTNIINSTKDEDVKVLAIREKSMWMEVMRGVQNAPTIEAEPVKHGRWIEDGYSDKPCVCSYCGEEAQYTSTFEETFDYDWEENLQSTGYEEHREYVKTNYCPNCGAKMDLECDA